MRCEELIRSPPEYLGPTDTVRYAAERMRDLNIGFLPVCVDGCVVGVLTDRDIVVRIVASSFPADTKVGEVMSEDVVECAPGDDVTVAERLMREAKVQRIVVSDEDDRLLGVVSLADLAQSDDPGRVASTLRDIAEREVVPAS